MSFINWRNKKSQRGLSPDEVEEYYEGDSSPVAQSRAVAIILGIFALALTVFVALIIFFGGRAIYRSVVTNNDQTTANSKQQSEKDDSANEKSKQKSSSSSKDKTGQRSTSSRIERRQPPSQPMPNTGDTSTLPATGDPGR